MVSAGQAGVTGVLTRQGTGHRLREGRPVTTEAGREGVLLPAGSTGGRQAGRLAWGRVPSAPPGTCPASPSVLGFRLQAGRGCRSAAGVAAFVRAFEGGRGQLSPHRPSSPCRAHPHPQATQGLGSARAPGTLPRPCVRSTETPSSLSDGAPSWAASLRFPTSLLQSRFKWNPR